MRLFNTFALLAVAGLTLASSAHAEVVASYNLGEDDAGAAAGNIGNDPTTAAVGGDLTRLGDPTYSATVPAGGSTLSMAFDGSGDYYFGAAPTTDVGNDFTISFDAIGSNGAAGFSFLASVGGNWGGMAVVEIGGNVTVFMPGGPGAGDGGFDLDGDQDWHNYVLAWDADVTTLTLSVDGNLVSTLVAGPANGQIVDAFTVGGNFRGTTVGDAPVPGSATAADFEGSFNGTIDNVVVDVVPEPGSLALLAFGCLVIARRRRG